MGQIHFEFTGCLVVSLNFIKKFKVHSVSKLHILWHIGLPHLRNLVNVYTSSNEQNDSVYTELPDLIFCIMQIGKIADIFP